MVEAALRGQSHPNFIRWSICNGNKARVHFVRNSGIIHILGALILGTLLVLSSASRWWRVFCFPLFFVGIGISVAACKGLCVIIHKSHSRALRPWEQFGVDGSGSNAIGSDNLNDDSTSIYISNDIHLDEEAALGHNKHSKHKNSNVSTDDVYSLSQRSKKGISLDTFGTSNSYGHELWVDRYKKQGLLKQIFAKQIWVQDQTIRLIQDRIVLQSHAWSLILSVPLTALFVALPVSGII